MKTVRIVTKGKQEDKTTDMKNVKFVTFERNFVNIVCEKKSYYFKNSDVIEMEVDNEQ